MPLVVERLHQQDSRIPVLIGGAAVNQAFADKINKVTGEESYGGGVYYCRDAFAALSILDRLHHGERETA